jgi:raffinose/stachyose/melibiose transport system permease protein
MTGTYTRRGFLGLSAAAVAASTGLAAGILIAVVPILIAYIFLQRWIVGGLTAGATKG